MFSAFRQQIIEWDALVAAKMARFIDRAVALQ